LKEAVNIPSSDTKHTIISKHSTSYIGQMTLANAYFTPPTRTRQDCLVLVGGVN